MILGITGRKFNGKDTVGKYLCDNYGFKRFAYADALKDACKCIFNFNDEQLYGSLKETNDPFWGVTPRKVLQFVGTDLFRNNMDKIMPGIGHDVWVKVLEKKIIEEHNANPTQYIVVTDVRFPNEVESIKRLGGTVIRVTRPQMNTEVDVHASEIEIEHLIVDEDILNDDTLQMLFLKCERLMHNEMIKKKDKLSEMLKKI